MEQNDCYAYDYVGLNQNHLFPIKKWILNIYWKFKSPAIAVIL